jgi:hypothetical protein
MLNNLSLFIHNKWVRNILTVISAIAIILQAFYYAHHMDVTMDEGTYLMKGLLFLDGTYTPFQDYGPWTNKMPLAFLIPGLAQIIFEPGLRTGRYFSIFLFLLMLIAVWLVTRRMAGKGWATLTLILVAANPAGIVYFVTATSQVIVACLIAWSLFFCLGKDRSTWQVVTGAILAAISVLTRQNIIPFLILLYGYIFWQHGRRIGLFALILSFLVLAIVHAIFWPRIFSVIWLPWIPDFMRPLFSDFAIQLTGKSAISTITKPDLLGQISVFFEGVRFHFWGTAGVVAAWLFFPKQNKWNNNDKFKAALFLSISYIVLLVLHYWASALSSYCPYCFPGYVAYFLPISMLIPVLVFSNKPLNLIGVWRNVTAALVVIVLTAGIAFAAYVPISKSILTIQVPRLKGMVIQDSTTDLWRLLANKFNLSFETLQHAVPVAMGLAAAIVIIICSLLIVKAFKKNNKHISPGSVALFIFLVTGIILAPTTLIGGSNLAGLCEKDVILSHEAVGKVLAESIPPGSLVYWQNDISPLPLLYIKDVRIFPPQLNHWYSRRVGGDAETLLKYGFWNNEMAGQWMREADYILMADRYGTTWLDTLMEEGYSFNELSPTPETVYCRNRSIIHIFKRIW